MGLDMTLSARRGGEVVEVGYWRKANAIHKWFVDNVQDGVDECQESPVDVDQLQTLLETVDAVMDDNDKANDLLPTQSGFFFGRTEIDEWYMEDLVATKKILEDAIARDDDWELFYQSSW